MCAIAGIFSKSEGVDEQEVERMCERMRLRGPDRGALYAGKQVGLGHRRLSVIDLSTGDQPMFSPDRSVVIVFNGEIYNFRELRQKLEADGQVFVTQSDTEVILNGYRLYGMEGILRQLEGMFAFALYDSVSGDLYLARDKFGEKPLFVREEEGKVSFASELKAFAPDLERFHLDTEALNYFLTLSYIPAPYTIYREIRKLMPGVYWKIRPDGNRRIYRYYHLAEQFSGEKKQLSFEEAKRELRERLTESVRRRMIADVPMGAFLSGGIDSSIVCALMSRLSEEPVRTFSIGFQEKDYDESDRAGLVVEHIKSRHRQYTLDYRDVVKELDDLILYYDEPFGDSSAIPSFYVARLARKEVKVVLTGDCADEVFAGYEKYLGHYYAERFRRLPRWIQAVIRRTVERLPYNRFTNNILRKAGKVIENAGLEDFDLYYSLMSLGFRDDERTRLLCPGLFRDIKPEIRARYDVLQGGPVLTREQLTDVQVVLEGDMFVKVDRACMKSSLENRAPFIDSGIVELAFRLPPEYKLKGRNKKYILKEAFKDLLPRKTFSFSKRGFGVPVDYWFRNELKDELKALLDKEFIERQGIFRYGEVQRLLTEHLCGRKNHKAKLWNLYVFQKWYLNQDKT